MNVVDRARNGLVAKGLVERIGDCWQLTPAGHAHVDNLIEQLKDAPPPAEQDGPPVRWNFRRLNH